MAPGLQWLRRKLSRVKEIRARGRTTSPEPCTRTSTPVKNLEDATWEAIKGSLISVVCWQDAPTMDPSLRGDAYLTSWTLPDFREYACGNDSDSETSHGGEGDQAAFLADMRKMVAACIREVNEVLPWVPGQYTMVRTLQESAQCEGRVDLMRNTLEGGFAMVRRVPTFVKTETEAVQQPSRSSTSRHLAVLGLVRHLNRLGFPNACEVLGAYQDELHTYFVTACPTGGDLATWCSQAACPGPQREADVRPLARQLLAAVRRLHNVGIAHRGLSLESGVLDDAMGEQPQVKLIDFDTATLTRRSTAKGCGKPAYQAPEMHQKEYDAFLADTFAVGVVIYTMAAHDYPWVTTRPGLRNSFNFYCAFGFRRLLERRKPAHCGGLCLAEVFSAPLADLLAGLLAVQPSRRLTLGERCWDGFPERPSVVSHVWLRPQEMP